MREKSRELKVKFLSSFNSNIDVEYQVNNWLETNNVMIYDIKFQYSENQEIVVMIMYGE